MNEKVEFLKRHGKWHPESEAKAYSRLTLEQAERMEANRNVYEFYWLDRLEERGELDVYNPPNIWTITFQRWLLRKYGLRWLADYLKKTEYAGKTDKIAGRLAALGVSENEIAALFDRKAFLSKICKIANRIPRSVSRKEAFTAAWKIVRNAGLELAVKGTSFGNRQEALKRLAYYSPKDVHVVLVPESDNPYDANAVSVQVAVNGGKGVYRLGYVPKESAAVVKAFLGTVPDLSIIGGDIRGARLTLAV